MQTRAASKRTSLAESSRAAAADVVMDPNLWGALPRELLLKVHASMELREFYQQRLVCKDWNLEASYRRCSTDSIRKPCFVMLQHDGNNPHTGIIAYNVSAGTWTFKFLTTRYRSLPLIWAFPSWDPVGDFLEPFTVDGILFGKGCFHPSFTGHVCECIRFVSHYFLYDVQTGVCIMDSASILGSFDATTRDEGTMVPHMEGSVVGMMVDTSKKPHGVKLIVGTPSASTLILDSYSETWKAYPSHMIRNRAPSCPAYAPKACTSCDGKMYIWMDTDEIQVYSLEQDRWSTLDAPPRSPYHQTCRGLGHWQKEVYAVTQTDWFLPTVWKLGETLAWEKFEQMPANLWPYLTKPLVGLSSRVARVLIVSHCNEYLLMHAIVKHGSCRKTRLRPHVLFSLASKRWETVEVPASEMRIPIEGCIQNNN